MLNYLMNEQLAKHLTNLYVGLIIDEFTLELITNKVFNSNSSKFEIISYLDEIISKCSTKELNTESAFIVSKVEVLPDSTTDTFRINFIANENTNSKANINKHNSFFNELFNSVNNVNNKSILNKKSLFSNPNITAIPLSSELLSNAFGLNNSIDELEKYEFIINLIIRIETHSAELKEKYKQTSVLDDYIHPLEYMLKDL